MLARIIEWSLKNQVLVIIGMLFAILGGVWAMRTTRLDAIPDLSETQVIVYSRWDQSPDIIEDQVTYPIVTAMLGAPRVKAVRGFSDFGYSFVYIIFEDGRVRSGAGLHDAPVVTLVFKTARIGARLLLPPLCRLARVAKAAMAAPAAAAASWASASTTTVPPGPRRRRPSARPPRPSPPPRARPHRSR